MRTSSGLVGAVFILFAAGPAEAQVASAHSHGALPSAVVAPAEPGQAAFAAISEIVDLLSRDPATDWSKVSIDALREHLVDMDNVLMRAKVVTTNVPGGSRFDISGDGPVSASIQRMVAGQTRMLDGQNGMRVTSAPGASGATMTVTGTDGRAQAKIRALGFFGFVTSGAHHELHHLAIASGTMPH